MPNQTSYSMSQSPLSTASTTNEQAFSIEVLVRDYYAYIRRLALSILDDPHEAEDAAQETFIAAERALSTFRGEAQVKTWLSAIAVNTCRGRLRKRKMRLVLQTTLQALHLRSSRVATIEEKALQRESNRQLWLAVDKLDDKHRLPVLLRYVHDMSVPEIAVALGVNEGTVHSRLHYARYELQARLGHLESREEVSDEASNP